MKHVLSAVSASLVIGMLGFAPGFAGASTSLTPTTAKNQTVNLRKPEGPRYNRRKVDDEQVNLTGSGALNSFQTRLQKFREEQKKLFEQQIEERKFTPTEPQVGTGVELKTPHRRTGQGIDDSRIKYQEGPASTYIRNVRAKKGDGPCSGLSGAKLAVCSVNQGSKKTK